MDDDWDDYESGPYCQHWDDPADCEEQCRCGHGCRQHAGSSSDPCEVAGCECEAFAAPP